MSNIVNTIVSGGIGAAIGSVVVAFINTVSGKNVNRANAANLVTDAAGGLIDRLDKDNKRLSDENKHLRDAILALTDVIDDVIDAMPPDDAKIRQMRTKLKTANYEAKRVV